MTDGLELIYDDESGTWSEAPETYGSIAFETQEALEKAVNILNNYKWTSVDEELPEKYDYYLTYYHGRIHISEWSVEGWYNEKGLPIDDDVVEYWQPLPEPPKAIKG